MDNSYINHPLLSFFDEEVDPTSHFAYFSFSVGLIIRNTDKEEAICAACLKHDMHPLHIRSTNTNTETVVEVCVRSPEMLLADVEIGFQQLVQDITLDQDLRVVCDPIVHECEIPLLKVNHDFEFETAHLHLAYEKHGFVALPSATSKHVELMVQTKCIVLEHIQRILDQVERVKELDPNNKIKFREVMQRDVGRFDMDLSNLPELNEFFRFVSSDAPWMPLVSQILGSEWEVNITGVVTSTGGNLTKQQHWHADGPEQMTPNTAVCCFLPLLELTVTTGYTSFWSGTHKWKQQALLAYNIPTKMPPESFYRGMASFGDVLLYDYKVIHRGEANRMKEGEIRPIMYIVYSKPGFKETNFTKNSIHDILCTFNLLVHLWS
jgi:Asp-tRNA(Asn)/Glu-tRNA(Gln) amidotransferase C subunit